MSIIRLKNREDKRIQAGHVWIYSNEIDTQKTPLKSFKPGQLVGIENSAGKRLGTGFVNPNTLLSVRLLSRHAHQSIDTAFFEEKLLNARALRERCFSSPYYRLVFGESDGLPGLVIDQYRDIFVVQLNTAGMEHLKTPIIEALIHAFHPRGILLKNDSHARKLEHLDTYVETVYGDVPAEIELEENDTRFIVPLQAGQKTGWFFDHQENRKKLATYVNGKRVLDVFCYLGAWGIQALHHRASDVSFIDSSEFALDYVSKNIALNAFNAPQTRVLKGDAFDVLTNLILDKEQFDVVILDPPAFVKKRRDMAAGQQAYRQLNELAMQLLSPQGILFSASCSMLMSERDLLNAIRKASLNTHQPMLIIDRLDQAPDHPIHPAIEETQYLKGFVGFRSQGSGIRDQESGIREKG